MGPFDRFNDRAKRVLALAQDEAIRLNHDYIGPEHLLLALIREGEGVAARVLDSLGVDLGSARRNVEATVRRGDATTPPREITLHPRTKRIIEVAIEEARALGGGTVGTAHLLLGLVRVAGEDAGGVAAKVVGSLGIAAERIRQDVVARLGGQQWVGTSMPAGPPQPFDAQGRRRDWYCEDVLSGKLTVRTVYEDERVVGFEHPYPQYQLHGVVVPKAHIPSLLAAEALDGQLLVSMLRGVQVVATALGLDKTGFQVQANAAGPGVTPHMHWHVIEPGLPPPPRERATPATATAAGAGGHPTTGPFDRFDASGKRTLALAQDEAIRVRHNYIGTEHLLAGLARDDGIAGRALAELGVDLARVRTALEFVIGHGERPTTPSEITLSPRTKKVIELAIEEAKRLGDATVGSAHILLGVVREGEGIAAGILESLGVSLVAARQKVLDLMKKEPPTAAP